MLVGRDAELRELLTAIAGALADGRGFTALIGGEPGIGKTRLATECASRLRAEGVRVAWAACRQDGGAPPYWPWVQLLDRLGRSAAFAAAGQVEPEFARFLLFDAVAGALRAAAPVVLVLDDLHWADHPSLMLLDALGAHLGIAPVIVLGTYRDTEAGSVAGLAAERRILLRGLLLDDLGPALLDATGEAVTPATAAALHQRTGGNPFFAAEVVRMLRAEGALQAAAAGAVPGGVRAVLERRLDRLPADTETALRGAAALDAGTTTGVDTVLLAAVSGVAPAGLAELLAPALTERLLVADGGRYRFPHALVADTVTLRTPAGQRLDLHRRAAAALTLRMRNGTGDRAEVAHQQLAAARLSGDAAEACTAATAAASAAGTAMDGTAYEDAVGWLEAALAVAPRRRHRTRPRRAAVRARGRRTRGRRAGTLPARLPRGRRAGPSSRPGRPARRRGARRHGRSHRLRGRPRRSRPPHAAGGSAGRAARRRLGAAVRGVGPAVGGARLHRGRGPSGRPGRRRRRDGAQARRPARARRGARRVVRRGRGPRPRHGPAGGGHRDHRERPRRP